MKNFYIGGDRSVSAFDILKQNPEIEGFAPI